MAAWGVFEKDGVAERHVAPVDDEDRNVQAHIFDGTSCWCRPRRSENCRTVVIHNEPS